MQTSDFKGLHKNANGGSVQRMVSRRFTNQQLSDWKRYEKVRKRGKWNMFFPEARAATGMSSERYSFVMQNFSELKAAVEGKSANDKDQRPGR